MSNSFATLDCSLPGYSVHGISQARILKWLAIFFSRGSSQSGIELVSLALASRFFTTEHLNTIHLTPHSQVSRQTSSIPESLLAFSAYFIILIYSEELICQLIVSCFILKWLIDPLGCFPAFSRIMAYLLS